MRREKENNQGIGKMTKNEEIIELKQKIEHLQETMKPFQREVKRRSEEIDGLVKQIETIRRKDCIGKYFYSKEVFESDDISEDYIFIRDMKEENGLELLYVDIITRLRLGDYVHFDIRINKKMHPHMMKNAILEIDETTFTKVMFELMEGRPWANIICRRV